VLVATAPAIIGLAGCGSSRAVKTEAQLYEREKVDASESNSTFTSAVDRLLVRMKEESDHHGTVDLLALSGGGDYGAFGAGFLNGWADCPDPAMKRPEFDVVTGVSTGALLAPFAFIGTEQAYKQVEDIYRNPKSDWIQERGLLFFLPSNPSFMELPGLERDVRKSVSDPEIKQIAEQSRKGRVLAVGATDLDFGRQKFWNVGAEAEKVNDAAGVDHVQRILLASAAIPAVFPPVRIEESLYADGGVTANVFLRLDARSPQGLLQRWRHEYPGKPMPKVRYWIIVNNQLAQPPETVQPRWPSIVGPSLGTAIRSATVAEIRWLTAEADFTNTLYGTNIEVRVVAIPSEWRAPVKGDFKKETMNSLADLGRKLGADPDSWRLWTLTADQRAKLLEEK